MENETRSATPSEVVRYAGRILQDNGWVRRKMFANDKGGTVHYLDGIGFDQTPTKFCLLGALEYACLEITGNLFSKSMKPFQQEMMAAISTSIRLEGSNMMIPTDVNCCNGDCMPSVVASWNDTKATGKDQVVRVLMRAADMMEGKKFPKPPRTRAAEDIEYAFHNSLKTYEVKVPVATPVASWEVPKKASFSPSYTEVSAYTQDYSQKIEVELVH